MSNVTDAESFLLENSSALAIALFLSNRRGKVDQKELEAAFGDRDAVRVLINQLLVHNVIDSTPTAKGRRPRAFLTSYGFNCVKALSEAAAQRRQVLTESIECEAVTNEMSMVSITSFEVENASLVEPILLNTEITQSAREPRYLEVVPGTSKRTEIQETMASSDATVSSPVQQPGSLLHVANLWAPTLRNKKTVAWQK